MWTRTVRSLWMWTKELMTCSTSYYNVQDIRKYTVTSRKLLSTCGQWAEMKETWLSQCRYYLYLIQTADWVALIALTFWLLCSSLLPDKAVVYEWKLTSLTKHIIQNLCYYLKHCRSRHYFVLSSSSTMGMVVLLYKRCEPRCYLGWVGSTIGMNDEW